MSKIETAHKQLNELERAELTKEINLIPSDTGYIVSKRDVDRLFGSKEELEKSLIYYNTGLIGVTELPNGNVTITRYRETGEV